MDRKLSKNKIKEIKMIFNSLEPEQQNEGFFTKNYHKFRLPNRGRAKAVFNEYLQFNRC